MHELKYYGKEIKNIFQLLGSKENDITKSIAWAMCQCDEFTRLFIKECLNIDIENSKDISIHTQEVTKENGVTDIEIICLQKFHIIVEAKRGWHLPTEEQIQKYINRKDFKQVSLRKIVTMSECTKDYAEINLPFKEKQGVSIQHLSWKDIYKLANNAIKKSSNNEKNLLRQLMNYLEGIMTMQNQRDNLVYICTLSDTEPKDGKMSYREVTKKYNKYFHPVGRGYPKEPPNYIAFRYNGKLQSIHHIDKYEVVYNIHEKIDEMPDKYEDYGLYLYDLGKAIIPPVEVKSFIKGKDKAMWRNASGWAALDLLLTCDSIKEAIELTKKRINE